MYFKWDQKTINDFSEKNTEAMYDIGFVFTRIGKGAMDQTRSLRINLGVFKLNSENRRILRKTENIILEEQKIPYKNYNWSIHKLGKDFYSEKFGEKTFSAQKIKELITDKEKSNFNKLFIYRQKNDNMALGYCICFETKNILHYCYPFYDLTVKITNLGLGMMTKAIEFAYKQEKKYVYLGSFQRPSDVYKLQFEGLEWFDGKQWIVDIKKLKGATMLND
jgi:arginyl-tRNA--protein-N-Asp/Glu arginylyltransferase